ncbi:alpha/beta fold hydrolase [Algivirga pacifica]|uniref:Alpha/beta fold hydrolase n=1 Tax=Algivirga pacifica TaxID=1162670 RepID=A0ABP9CYS1_9BACT
MTTTLQTTSLFIPIGNDQLHLKRFYNEDSNGEAVLMIHGAIENGSIFYAKKKLKGLAPFLAQEGYDVYVVDLRGRGLSTPAVNKTSTNTQYDTIMEEIPACIQKIRAIRSEHTPIHTVAHSWGGVLLLAYLARHPQETFKSMNFLATKRSIKVKNIKKLWEVDVFWSAVGEMLTRVKGYLPAKEWGFGADNESRAVYRDCRQWVYALNEWKSNQDGFDYLDALAKANNIPPTLYLTGLKEYYLGHQMDVKRLMKEVNNPQDQFILLSKENGFKKDYDHINICTSKEGPQDHFPLIVEWMRSC